MSFLDSLRLDALLSFRPGSDKIALTPLNVLIGPNGSGKSNLIEAIELLHATPTAFADAIRDGGGAAEWIWKGDRAAGLLKYPSWTQKARDGASRVRQRQKPGSVKSVPLSGRHASVSAEEFERATQEFRAREPRAVVYDAAQVLLAAAIADYDHLSPAVAVAALIQSWNFAYYKSIACDAAHVVDLEFALHSIWKDCVSFRERDIASFARVPDGPAVRQVFSVLETVLGRVGAPKAMHLIAPNFFPLWDNFIAPAYGLELGAVGQNSETYLAFMELVQRQAAEVRAVLPARPDVLKAIDEYNYCRYSKSWI